MNEELKSLNSHYQFDENPNPINKHYFLSEELLIPNANSTNSQRGNLFANHINQLVHLKYAEFPRVFTNFENQIGQYSISRKVADCDYEIVDKIIKNSCNYDLIVKTRNKEGFKYDIIQIRAARNITETYGYEIFDKVKDKKVGDKIYEGEEIYSCSLYDKYGNFGYGVNLKALYLPYKNRTYEDGVVISESAAKKLTSYKVEEIWVSLNKNDILINIYGVDENGNPKSFPRVGEKTKDRILCSRRRIDYKKALYDLQNEQLTEIDHNNDDIFYTVGGTVVDIDIFSNADFILPGEEGYEDSVYEQSVFTRELRELYEQEYQYYQKLFEVTSKIIERSRNPKNKITYSDDLAYAYVRSKEWIDPTIKWSYHGSEFEHVLLKFTILKEEPALMGSKITGRYGNKGIVAEIVPDEKMPVTENGIRVDIILNSLGVVNRLNPSQIKEQHLNFMADRLREKMKEMDYQDAFDYFMKFLKIVNKEQHEFIELESILWNRSQIKEFVEDIIENGIYIHQPPFYGNTTFDDYIKIYKEMPELCKKYTLYVEGKKIERPLVVGDQYFILLKHTADSKFSARSTAQTNMRNIPSKSMNKKNNKDMYSKTPIRVGEQEVGNLLLTKNAKVVQKLLKSYSTSEEDRMNLVANLLTSDNPHDIDIELTDEKSNNRKILDSYLSVLGLELANSEENNEDNIDEYDVDKNDIDENLT